MYYHLFVGRMKADCKLDGKNETFTVTSRFDCGFPHEGLGSDCLGKSKGCEVPSVRACLSSLTESNSR